MRGLMQDWPLLVSKIIEHGALNHHDTEIVTLTVEGGRHCYTMGDCHRRSKKTAEALIDFGIGLGDRVATLAWNTHRHVELWYGISGMGAVAHTVNPRLFADQITYIMNHAEDRILCLDLTFVPMIEEIAGRLETIEAYVILTDEAHMPETTLENVICYETFIEAQPGTYNWPKLDENTAAGLCYTSGTTGNPKGVLYSHRSNYLHTMGASCVDTIGAASGDVIMPVVPMFHANAWGIPYTSFAVGAKLVLNGPYFDAETLSRVMIEEGVTQSAAVPTVWLGLLDYLKKTGIRLDKLEKVVIGGAAAPKTMIEAFEKEHNVTVVHAWGMTETSPLGTVGTMTAKTSKWPWEDQLNLKAKQGRAILGVEMKIIDDDGNELDRDGVKFGHLMVRGPWVSSHYFKDEGGDILDADGWFDTGDVATMDENGYMQITDRSKDVIKSGGEWISSIELENAAVDHESVAEAAVIGISHPKWNERPLLIVVLNEGYELDPDALRAFLSGKVAKWWLPDEIVTIDEIPHTAAGKIRKTELRETFADFEFPAES
ncbi:MAG: long-chain-fatty-acid--CoA ligase [Sphingomonadales bacterium]